MWDRSEFPFDEQQRTQAENSAPAVDSALVHSAATSGRNTQQSGRGRWVRPLVEREETHFGFRLFLIGTCCQLLRWSRWYWLLPGIFIIEINYKIQDNISKRLQVRLYYDWFLVPGSCKCWKQDFFTKYGRKWTFLLCISMFLCIY